MGLIVSITLVLGLIFYWEGRRLYKEPEEHSSSGKINRFPIEKAM